MKKIVCQSLSKALNISSVTGRAAPDLLKALVILGSSREVIKPYQKSEKHHISPGDQQASQLQVFQRLY